MNRYTNYKISAIGNQEVFSIRICENQGNVSLEHTHIKMKKKIDSPNLYFGIGIKKIMEKLMLVQYLYYN